MRAKLARAEAGDFTGLWEDMLKANGVRTQFEVSVGRRNEAREQGADTRLRVRRA